MSPLWLYPKRRRFEFVSFLTCRRFGFVAVLVVNLIGSSSLYPKIIYRRLGCRRCEFIVLYRNQVGLSPFWICHRFGCIQNGGKSKTATWYVAVLVVDVLDVSPFWMCRRFGVSPFWTCRRFGVSPFWLSPFWIFRPFLNCIRSVDGVVGWKRLCMSVCVIQVSPINELHYRVLMYWFVTEVAKNATLCQEVLSNLSISRLKWICSRIDIITLTIKLQMATSNIPRPNKSPWILTISLRLVYWKSWRKTWTRFEVATGIDEVAEKKRMCTLLSGSCWCMLHL